MYLRSKRKINCICLTLFMIKRSSKTTSALSLQMISIRVLIAYKIVSLFNKAKQRNNNNFYRMCVCVWHVHIGSSSFVGRPYELYDDVLSALSVCCWKPSFRTSFFIVFNSWGVNNGRCDRNAKLDLCQIRFFTRKRFITFHIEAVRTTLHGQNYEQNDRDKKENFHVNNETLLPVVYWYLTCL